MQLVSASACFVTYLYETSSCTDAQVVFQGGKLAPIHLQVAEGTYRAVQGGTGSTKCAGNYASGLVHAAKARRDGFTDVVYLDAETGVCNTRPAL